MGHLKVIGDVGSAWCLGRSQSLQDTQHPLHPLKGVAPHHVTARCPCNDFGGDCVGTAEYLRVGERMRSFAIYRESRKGPALPDAGAAVLGSVVPLRQRAGGLDVFSNGRDQMSPQVGNTAQTCQQDLLIPVLQMVVPSDKLA